MATTLRPAQIAAAIPPEVRPLVVDYLEAQATNCELTATRLRQANKKIRDKGTELTATYWTNVAAGCRLVAHRIGSTRKYQPLPEDTSDVVTI